MGPIALAERRIAWADRRQEVLAQNIANADTPGYAARDIPSFRRVLAASARAADAPQDLARTSSAHLPAPGGPGPRARKDRLVAERSPDGNGVSLDEQALKVADTDSAHALAMGLHRKFLGFVRIALGRAS